MTELEPLPPELQALFAAERERPGPSEELTQRLFARVSASIGIPPDGGGGEEGGDNGGGGGGSGDVGGAVGGGASGPAPSGAAPPAPQAALPHAGTSAVSPSTMPPPAPLPTATTAANATAATAATAGSGATAVAGATTAAAKGLGGLLAKPLLIAAVAFAGGAAAGVAAMRATTPALPSIQRTPPKIVVVHAPASSPAVAPQSSITPEDLEREAPLAQHIAGVPASAKPETTGRDLDLGKERALLSTARTALAKRDGPGALAALDRHAGQFPNGRLAEERASLRVQALLLSGDRTRATREAEEFKQAYPKSLLKGAVEKSVAQP